MISQMVCVAVRACVGLALRARHSRRVAERAEAGEEVSLLVMARRGDRGGRFTVGRVRTGVPFRWVATRPWARLRELPAGLRDPRIRPATFGESLWLPPRGMVIECGSSTGLVLLGVRPEHQGLVASMIRRAGDTSDR
ncbi:hypothetical protein ABT026_10785 [Streptomyces sp. NPDC002734]|uniref:hypothetical protein n=1 Tax=Streptomyces sp. NPDC002734 TaxID=3154426 RepID=UPI00332213A3